MSENGSQKMQSTVYRTCAEFDEMFHVPKSTNSNEILDVNEICDAALGHAVSDVNQEAVENGDGMATFDELFSFNKENRTEHEYVDSPDVAAEQDESVLEETLIAEAPVESHHAEPTLESMLSVDPECLPAPDVDAPTLESKLEALVGEMKPEKNGLNEEQNHPQASDFGPGAILESEEVVVGAQELNPDDYEILDGPIETQLNDEEMTLNLVPVEEGTVPVEDQQAYENGGDHFVEGANSHEFAHEENAAQLQEQEHGEHVLYDIAEQNENSIFDEKPKPNLFSQNSQNVDDRIQAQVISQKPIQPRPVGVTPAPIKAKKPRVRARPKRKPSIQSVSASPAPTILTLVPTSGTGTGAAGTQNSTISSSVAQSSNILSVSGSNNIQIIQSPQILSAGGTQVYQLGPNGTLTPVMQPLIQQFVLQPVNSTESSGAGSRVIRLQSTPAGVTQVPTTMLSSTQTPMILNSTPNRRLSLQTEIAPGSSRQQLIKPSSILTPLVPDKSTPVPLTPNGTNLGSVFKTMQLHSPAIRPAEPNHPGLSAQDRLIKQRQEMRKRYEMLREAAEIRRDETFKPYRARKVRGRPHPDPVIESIALSSVTVPDVSTKISLPHDIVEEGKLSDLQLEAVVYAKQQHAGFYPSGERKGFLLGDGAGVGKGRSISGIIYDNWLNGRKKAIWLSVSNDLRHDSLRDLGDIGANMIKVHPLHKFKYGHKLSDKENGRIQEGVIFGTYASLIGERHQAGATTKRAAQATRLHQLVTWCGRNFDGCIVFDECHKAKNLYQANGKPSKTGTTVLELQRQLKQARIVYASATGASEPKHMSYMSRLGLWGAGTGFKSSEQFVDALTKAGVGAMELVAMDMKRRGVYLARQLSFEGCEFELEEVPLDGFFMTLYDAAAELWRDAKDYFSQAANLLGDDFKMPGMWQQFWGAHQRFFKYLTMAAKVNKACQIARKAVRENQCVVIGLQSTGEQRTNEEMDRIMAEGEEINEMVSSCKGVFRRLLDTHFPVSDRDKLAELGINFDLPDSPDAAARQTDKKPRYMSLNTTADSNLESDAEDDLGDLTAAFGESDDENDPNAGDKEKQENAKKRVRVDSISDHFRAAGFKMRKVDKEAEEHRKRKEAIEQCAHLKRTLWEKLLKIKNLPGNALDELMDGLGGPEMVSEMTGRKNRQIITDKGVQYENRAQSANVPLEQINLIEKEHFMSGKKQYAIISDAASSGISLHCDRRCQNQNRRVHLTLELPWSADKAVQQFGRTHRSNQVCPPKYCFLISELAGEQRFASIVARRLESMGALTHGDRRTAQKHGDLSRFNFDTNYGKKSLDLVLKSILGEERNSVSFPEFYHGNFVEDMKRALYEIGIFVWKDENKSRMRCDGDITVSKFLNRLLGISIACQQGLFHYFSETLDDIMTEARANGTLEEGVMDVGNANDKLEIAGQNTFTTSDDCTLKLVKINHYKGVEWVDALNQSKRLAGKFYVDESGKLPVMLYPKGDKFVCIRPNHSVVDSAFEMSYWQTQFKLKDEPVDPSAMAQIWRECYQETANKCIHEFTNGFCSEGLDGGCLTGRRLLELFILSGPVLAVWNSIQDILHQVDKASRIQIVRLRTSDRERIVGILIPSNCAQTLVKTLEKIQEKNKPKTKSKLGRKKKVLAEATAQVLTAAQQLERDRELELMASQIINEAGGAAISPHVGSVGNSSSGFDEPREVDEEVTEEQRQKDFLMMDEEARDAEFERLAAQMVFQNDEEEDDFF